MGEGWAVGGGRCDRAEALWRAPPPGTGGACSWLRGHGLGQGKRLGLALDANTPAAAALLCAAPLLGVCVVPIGRRLAAAEAAALVEHAALDALAAPPVHVLAGRAHPLPTAFPDAPLPTAEPDPAAPALVLATSGTTGTPKLARLSLRAVLASVDATVQALALGPGDRYALVLALEHIAGCAALWRCARAGCALDLHARFDAVAASAAIDAGATAISLVPTMLHRLIAARAGRPWPASLGTILTGGGALDPGLAAACAALGRAPRHTYALTEAGGTVAIDGVPLPGLMVRVDAEEIILSGPQLFAGYEHDGRLVPAGAAFATGDLGRWNGTRLEVLGRRDDRFKSGGIAIDPLEVERALCAHPAVAEAAVAGIPDPEWGQVVGALLVARGDPVALDDLRAALAPILSAAKHPRRIRWVAELPRNAGGKVDRRAVMQALMLGN